MARIRTIKPEFPQSESMGRVSRDARLLFVMLWTICDDHGRTRAHSRMLASLLFPYDEDAGEGIKTWLSELEDQGCIRLYEVEGSAYLEIVNWGNHQKIDRPSKPQFPGYDEATREPSRDTRERSSEERTKDQGPRKGKEHSSAPTGADLFSGVDPRVVADFRAMRKAKKAAVTETAVAGIRREADKAGWSLEQALRTCCERGWIGFKADWVAGDRAANGQAPAPDRARQLL